MKSLQRHICTERGGKNFLLRLWRQFWTEKEILEKRKERKTEIERDHTYHTRIHTHIHSDSQKEIKTETMRIKYRITRELMKV